LILFIFRHFFSADTKNEHVEAVLKQNHLIAPVSILIKKDMAQDKLALKFGDFGRRFTASGEV
jgi:hypothetical protein